MDPCLSILERHLGLIFVPGFAEAIIDKQLRDIGESRESFTREELDDLLDQVEKKVLRTFLKEKSGDFLEMVRRDIEEVGVA